ncbi:MAG: hypothetical protein IKC03_10765 [Oscillospiraceae bacterium]|nr:hypothetical protein [Oscillospiraceae bacterium]
MANDRICVFCGERVGAFKDTLLTCGDTRQFCCKSCAKELKPLNEAERCRRALRLGLAEQSEQLEERIELITKAEEYRPICLRCGGKMKFEPVQYLDNSPMRDSIFSDGFEVQPAYCESCGKYEFYKPTVTNKNRFIAYLIHKDTSQ